MKDSNHIPRWVTAKEYAKITGLSTQVLNNWRYEDRKNGRSEPRPGYPIYRRFGNCVRYYVEPELLCPALKTGHSEGAAVVRRKDGGGTEPPCPTL